MGSWAEVLEMLILNFFLVFSLITRYLSILPPNLLFLLVKAELALGWKRHYFDSHGRALQLVFLPLQILCLGVVSVIVMVSFESLSTEPPRVIVHVIHQVFFLERLLLLDLVNQVLLVVIERHSVVHLVASFFRVFCAKNLVIGAEVIGRSDVPAARVVPVLSLSSAAHLSQQTLGLLVLMNLLRVVQVCKGLRAAFSLLQVLRSGRGVEVLVLWQESRDVTDVGG